LEGTAYTMVNGYPVATVIAAMADLSGYVTAAGTATTLTVGGSLIIATGAVVGDECFTYTGGTTVPAAATVSILGAMTSATACSQ
jgi:hypothetical protein